MPEYTLHKMQDKFPFGKHRGETVRQVLIDDPGYILWLHEEEIVNFSLEIILDAEGRTDDD